MKRPWFSFYASDWLTDSRVRRMSPEERGFYMDLLAYSWTENGIPEVMIRERAALARICGVSTRLFDSLWRSVQDRFELDSSSKYRQARLEWERNRADKFSETQSKKAKTKWTKDAAAVSPAYASDSTTQHSTTHTEETFAHSRSESDSPEGSKCDPGHEKEPYDFEAGYAQYPKKIGRKKGLQRFNSQITTAAKYDAWLKAIANYSASVAGKDLEYVKQFDTFMNCWEDWVACQQELGGPRRYKNFSEPRPAVAETKDVDL